MTNLRDTLREALARARTETDGLFELVSPTAMYDRPIPERHRIVFYLGHFEAFDWNMIADTSFGMSAFNAEFDRLFSFGIDPVDGRLPQDRTSDWPSLDEIVSYNGRVRRTIDDLLECATFERSNQPYIENGQIFRVAIEHRLMHAETLAYMLHWLPYDQKHSTVGKVYDRAGVHRAPPQYGVQIPKGTATLGQSSSFGWDNEFDAHTVDVPEFAIDAFNTTNKQFLEFIDAGGYETRSLWSEEGWQWIQSSSVRKPKFWIDRDGQWFYRSMFAEIPLPLGWPVYVSYAEAQAYARWAHKSVPTEEQFHRAAFGSTNGSEHEYPWGNAAPAAEHGNFDFRSWTPSPVGAYAEGRSAFGVFDMVGNGWEWTRTPFAPFADFQAFPFYPGYSGDFFDGKHFVLKGASPRTAASLVRRSFRNWFQPYYPNIYATFRCVDN